MWTIGFWWHCHSQIVKYQKVVDMEIVMVFDSVEDEFFSFYNELHEI
jgi:hypothetical protein